jgi:hypothetical protein
VKIVRLLGGLGNQMFQYAFAKELERRRTEEVFFDVSGFDSYALHTGLELERLFGLQLRLASPEDSARLSTRPTGYARRFRRRYFPKPSHYIDRNTAFHEDVFSLEGDRYYEGYWQSEGYFHGVAADLRRLFAFPALSARNADFLAGLARPACSVHVRRGDYLSTANRFLQVCSPAYFARAVHAVSRKREVRSIAVFSDDPEWCRSSLDFGGRPIHLVDWNKDSESWQDMALMAACEHHVIANSSFSWWGAWLGEREGGEIVAPDSWSRPAPAGRRQGNNNDYADTVPERWTRVSAE